MKIDLFLPQNFLHLSGSWKNHFMVFLLMCVDSVQLIFTTFIGIKHSCALLQQLSMKSIKAFPILLCFVKPHVYRTGVVCENNFHLCHLFPEFDYILSHKKIFFTFIIFTLASCFLLAISSGSPSFERDDISSLLGSFFAFFSVTMCHASFLPSQGQDWMPRGLMLCANIRKLIYSYPCIFAR